MTALAIRRRAPRSFAVPLLQIFAVTLMVFPSNSVLKAVGGAGYVAALVSFFLFLAYVITTLFGYHNPLDHRSPVRFPLCTLWLVSLVSYLLINRTLFTPTELTGADRWLMQLAGVSGVILVASEFLHSFEDIRRVLRALVWGGAFCGIVAGLQFRLNFDLSHYLRELPGFSLNQANLANSAIGNRGGLNRVPGTATDPIELGVSAGMLLPLAVYLAMYDIGRSGVRRWLPVICIAIAIPASVSRSAFLAVGIAFSVFVALLPAARRLTGITIVLLGVAGIFVAAHGLLGTLKAYFLAGASDPSVAHRVNNYAFVEQLVREHPWFGQGGGTFIPADATHILDNEYLGTAIQLGLLGLVALIFFFLWPALTALAARARTADPSLRALCAALAGAELAAVLSSAFFDSLSFPMFVNIQALIAGLIGAVWLLVSREGDTVFDGKSSWKPTSDTVSRRQLVDISTIEPGGGS